MLNSMPTSITLRPCLLSTFLRAGASKRPHRILATSKASRDHHRSHYSTKPPPSSRRTARPSRPSSPSHTVKNITNSLDFSPVRKNKTSKDALRVVKHESRLKPLPPPLSSSDKQLPTTFSDNSLSFHWNTTPPTPAQLAHASRFFKLQPPEFLWSTSKFKTMDFGSSPEVCFLGRSNVGKSSLLNALVYKNIAHTSAKPGRTKTMNAFAIGGPESEGKPRLVLLDMPGYGKGGVAEWGKQILKYLSKRRQLKRAFLLVNSEHGLKDADRRMLKLFEDIKVPYQVILSKADRVLGLKRTSKDFDAIGKRFSDLTKTVHEVKVAVEPDSWAEEEEEWHAVGEIIACSSETWVGGKKPGIDAVRFAMLKAAGMELQKKPVLAKPIEIVPHDQVFE